MARATFRIILSNGGRLGHGKIELLEAIERSGSISAGGRALRVSYKRAWDLIDEANRMFGAPLVATRPGGKGGGGAALTERGREVLNRYRAFEAKALAAAGEEITALDALACMDGPRGAPVGGEAAKR